VSRAAAIVVAALFLSAAKAAPAQERWQAAELARIEGMSDIAAADGARNVILARAAAGTFKFALRNGRLAKRGPIAATRQPAGTIPHARMGSGRASIGAAFLAEPTRRYRHGVLGDDIEAAAVVAFPLHAAVPADIRTASLRYTLPDDSVFEDLVPRVADLDGDERDEIVLIRAYVARGAALAVLGVRDGRLALLAESPAFGRPNRWLDVAGIGDFLGLGRKRLQIAVVETPHIGGVLVVYEYAAGRLIERLRAPGYATHAIGSPVIGMAAVIPGAGADDLVLPTQDRRALVALTFAGGVARERARVALPAPVATSLLLVETDSGGPPDLVFGTGDGRLFRVRR
jgi:hypothetical protein